MKKVFLVISIFIGIASFATEKIAIANLGNGWSNPLNWLPTGVPQSNDVVTIPLGLSLTVKGDIYTGTPKLIVKIYGTLDFDPSGKLDLDNNSYIQIYKDGKIASNGSSSEIITIGGNIKYNGQNDGTINGPKFASIASPNSIPGSVGAGFEDGVLPIKLYSFNYKVAGNNVNLSFSVSQDSNEDEYFLERLEGANWKTLQVFKPLANTQKNDYSYTDKSVENGTKQYRLKLVSASGEVQYSKILKVQITNNLTHMIVYPNPTNGQTRIQWDAQTKPDKIIVYDVLSKVVFQDNVQPQKSYYDINLLNMRNGHYYVTLLKENLYIENTQFIKK